MKIFVLLLALSFPTMSFAVIASDYEGGNSNRSYEKNELLVEGFVKQFNISSRTAQKLIEAAEPYQNGVTFIAIAMTASRGEPRVKSGDQHGALLIPEWWITTSPFNRVMSSCGVTSVEDLYDMDKSFCSMEKVFIKFDTLFPKDKGKGLEIYMESSKKGKEFREEMSVKSNVLWGMYTTVQQILSVQKQNNYEH
jgi:hypothetical protein